ncbi:PaaI family thioesterase [Martelella limonii]|uniref:PaaI family thioesterase n=1 Tax=Martelella limonii TaxID=1647649 RepID=UPI001580BEA9|nr:PaaI family thioesterase [Martelella limonii]
MAAANYRSLDEMPPRSTFSLLMGIEIVTCTPEEVVCTMTATEAMSNRNGVLHGGALMTLADTAAGTAAFICSPANITNTTIEAKTNFIRAVKLGETVTARCAPVHVGRTTAVLEVTMTRDDGKVVGIATQTHLYLGGNEGESAKREEK